MDFDGDGVTDVTLELSSEASEYNRITLTRYDQAGRVIEAVRNYWLNQPVYYLEQYNLSTRTFYDNSGRVVARSLTTMRRTSWGTARQAMDFDGDGGTTEATLEVSPDFRVQSDHLRPTTGRAADAGRSACIAPAPGQAFAPPPRQQHLQSGDRLRV
jgi:hypothetical protein